MTVFISWSGERSKAVARTLKTTLAGINGQWEPWVSHTDISAGVRWRDEISHALQSANFGVVCISRLPLRSPWVLFETGALSASIKTTGICPYLIDHDAADVQGPLSDFQSCEANEEGTWDLILALNSQAGPQQVAEHELKRRFKKYWPELEESIKAAPDETDVPSKNNLDEKGLNNLLHIHFDAASDRLMEVFEQGLDELDSRPTEFNFDLLLINAKRVLDEGRILLVPYYSDSTGSVSSFLDECLPTSDVEGRIKQRVKIVLNYKDAGERRRAAYQLIQEEQARLMRIVSDRLKT